MNVLRYHALLVALHWLLAILILEGLGIGYFSLPPTLNSDTHKLDVLALHMAGGMLIVA